MASFELRTHVGAPRDLVFEAATDLRKMPEFVRGIERLEVMTDGPVGVGTRFRETRIVFRKEATEEMEFTAFDAPHRYAVRSDSHGCRFDSEFRFEEKDGGTDVVLEFRVKPLTMVAKVSSVLMRPMLKACTKQMLGDLEDMGREAAARASVAQR